MQPYTEDYYKSLQEGSRKSAREIIPIVIELIQPRSVIDVGCGMGTWLSVFKEYGVKDIFGVDGDHIDKTKVKVPAERFLAFDLKKPFRMDRQFDLVVSLEVAEHLPSECAELFADSLTRLGPVILFSTAIPFQGGTHHVNEQWPDYWVRYFQERGYLVVDNIRKKIWQNKNVAWWYAQNTLMFVREDYLESHPLLKKEFENTVTSQLSIVHPKNYLHAIWMQQIYQAKQDIVALIPPEDSFILVDENRWRFEITLDHHTFPFLERDGQYWGPPSDDDTAIREIERMRRLGANFIVFSWPAFWWLDYYAQFYNYLCLEFRCILKNDRLVIFDLQQ